MCERTLLTSRELARLSLRVGDVIAVDDGRDDDGAVRVTLVSLRVDDAAQAPVLCEARCGPASAELFRRGALPGTGDSGPTQAGGSPARTRALYRLPAAPRVASSIFVDGAACAAALGVPRTALAAQLASVCDGAVLPRDGALRLRVAGATHTLRVLRALPFDGALLRVESGRTLIVVTDEAEPILWGRDGAAAPTRGTPGGTLPTSPALSPWKAGVERAAGAVGSGDTSLSPHGASRPGVTCGLDSAPAAAATSAVSSAEAPGGLPGVVAPPVVAAGARSRGGVAAALLRAPGLERPLAQLVDLLLAPFSHPRDAAVLRVPPARGVLLHGPPGCGKTTLARALAAAAVALPPPGVDIAVFDVVAGDLRASAAFGAAESRLRVLWAAAEAHAAGGGGSGHGSTARGNRGAPPSPPPAGATEATTGAAAALRPRLALVLLEDVDVLCPRRSAVPGGGGDGASVSAARLIAQLLTLLDGAGGAGARGGAAGVGSGCVAVLATTSRPDAIDPALRRPGRLDREVRLRAPDAGARARMLAAHAAALPLTDGARAALPSLAARCVGFSGADLAALCGEAARGALGRTIAAAAGAAAAVAAGTHASAEIGADSGAVTAADMEAAVYRVGASALRGGGVSVGSGSVELVAAAPAACPPPAPPPSAPHDPWAGIGGLDATIAALRAAVELPLSRPAAYAAMRLAPPRGVLLHGPPGNSKTTLAAALAAACGATFLPLAGADVYSPYLGEAERAVRDAFARAREAAPAILFLDEVDALVGRRGLEGAAGGGGGVSVGVLATLLAEMDGVGGCDGVVVLAATNRPDVLDPALLRPGRLEVHIAVPSPDAAGRAAVLAVHARRMPLAADVDVARLAPSTAGWSGAQLENLCREAGMGALRRALHREEPGGGDGPMAGALAVTNADFDEALRRLASPPH